MSNDQDDFAEAVRASLPEQRTRVSYAAVVRIQHSDDLTVDVELTDAGAPFRSLSRIPFRSGLPASRVRLEDGDRVRVAFEGGNGDGAFAFAPDMDPNASKAVARVGDSVDCGWWIVVPFGVGAYALQRLPDPPAGSSLPPPAVNITGVITSGSDRVKL